MREPLEPHRNVKYFALQARCDARYQLGADHGLAHGGLCAPLGPVAKQVVNGHRQVVVRRQQSIAWRNDAVAVVVGVAGKGNVEAVLECNESLHGIAR